MNLEIANRLVALRKENNLSQEALAEKLGISRQAVSKWERAEASPDTDNLIALAKLYHISLDELLKIHEDEEDEFSESISSGTEQIGGGYVGAGQTMSDNDKAESGADCDGIRVNGDAAEDHIFAHHDKDAELPLGLLAIISYIIIGFCFDLWHPGWLIFLLIPIISTFIHAIHRHNPDLFAYPVLAVLVFLYVGFVYYIWHPTWVVFLTIPLYYSVTRYIRRTRTKDVYDE